MSTNIKVKICGIRSIEAAIVAIDEGADFLGFNFVPTSKRYINPFDAAKIINVVKGKVKIVGVFQDADVNHINNLSLSLGLDFVQLHGDENNEYINNVGIPVIKSFKIDSVTVKTKATYVLLDRPDQGKSEMVDFEKAAKLASHSLIFYAGGLNPNNVAEVVRIVKPFAVDVAGGIETNGHQDPEKIKLFIRNVKGMPR